MVRRKYFILLFALSVIIFCASMVGTIHGLTSVSVLNEFETGVVDIHLTEHQVRNGAEELWTDKLNILPGDNISKIPRIHNDGADCYVRAKLNFRDTKDISEVNIYGFGDKWKKADDGYYYYTDILEHGASIDIFKGIVIPKNYSQANEGKAFCLDIAVDAIQSKNFEPLFDTAAPWGDVEILMCEKEGEYDVSTFKTAEEQSFKIVYEGDAEKLVTNSEDFFVNFPYLMPGDRYQESVKVENNSDYKVNLYFRNDIIDDSELLEKIQLIISTNIDGKEKTIYEGNLKAEELTGTMLLGTIDRNSDLDEFNFEIYVPQELNNKYSLLHSGVKWTFSTEIIPENSAIPKTGDTSNILGCILLMLGSVILMVFSVISLKKRDKEEAEDV